MKAIERLYEYFESKSIKPTAFEKEIGLSNGYLGTQRKRNADMGEAIILKIINNCRDMSLIWLITGEGEMLKSVTNQQAPHSDDNSTLMELYNHAMRDKDTLNQEIGALKERIAQLERGKGRDVSDAHTSGIANVG